tara:strand:- start:186 stop:464 length:279 start_codon:yes stop_codon:yes gene_type:complete
MNWGDRFSINFDGPDDTAGHHSITILEELSDAFLGVLHHPNGPPIACYSHSMAAAILAHNRNISPSVASKFVDYLAHHAKGSSAPAFLKADP